MKLLKSAASNIIDVIGGDNHSKLDLAVDDIAQAKADMLTLDLDYNPKPVLSRNERLLAFAAKEIGTKEVLGKGNSARVLEYHAFARQDNDLTKAQPDSTPWCASFVCFCLESVGMGSTNSMAARSFEKWGISSKAKPLPGDIVVFWRGKKSGWMGHVGFFVKQTRDYIYVLGGNQGDAVNVSKYRKDKLLDIRRSSKARISEAQAANLKAIGGQVIAGETVQTGGSVV